MGNVYSFSMVVVEVLSRDLPWLNQVSSQEITLVHFGWGTTDNP